MTANFLRKVRVTFNDGTILNPGDDTDPQIKISFQVERSLSGKANTASMSIWNLGSGLREALGKELDTFTIEAGYLPTIGGGNVGVIAKCNIRDVKHERDGPDIVTNVNGGDGDKALRKAVLSKTWPAGTKGETVLRDLHKELAKHDIAQGEWKDLDRLPEFRRPHSMCSTCARELDHLGRSGKSYWSIQNHVLEVVPGDGTIGQMIYVTPESGLIGSPCITDNGVTFKVMLNPEIAPGRPVYVSSPMLGEKGGNYRIGTVTFSGDNRDGGFMAECQAEEISGGKVNEGGF